MMRDPPEAPPMRRSRPSLEKTKEGDIDESGRFSGCSSSPRGCDTLLLHGPEGVTREAADISDHKSKFKK